MPWKKGQSGNLKGCPRKPEIELLRKAIAAVEKKRGKKLLTHFVDQAFEDNATLAALMRKLLADKKAIEGTVTGVIPVQLVDFSKVKGKKD